MSQTNWFSDLSAIWWQWNQTVLLQGGIAFLILLIGFYWMRAWPAKWKHVICMVVLLKFAVPWSVGISLPVLPHTPSMVETAPVPPSAVERFPDHKPASTIPLQNVEASSTQTVPTKIDRTPKKTASFWKVFGWMETLFLVWSIGLLLYVIRTTRNVVMIHNMKHAALYQEELTRLAHTIGNELDISGKVNVFVSNSLHSPLVVGLFRPAILLSPETTHMNDVQRRMLLCHELAHIRRNDHWINWLRNTIVTVMWWNPLVHRLNKWIGMESENSCDDVVLKHYPNRSLDYSRLLLDVAERISEPAFLYAGPALAEPKFAFANRLRRITMNNQKPIYKTTYFAIAFLLLMMIPFWNVNSIPVSNEEAADKSGSKKELSYSLLPPPATEAQLNFRIDGPVEASGIDSKEIIQILAEQSGMQYILDIDIKRQVTFHLNNPTVKQVLDAVLPAYGLDYLILGNGAVRIGDQNRLSPLQKNIQKLKSASISTTSPSELDQRIEEKVNFEKKKIKDILDFLHEKCGLNFQLDSHLSDIEVSATFEQPTVRQILYFLMTRARLDYLVVSGGTIFLAPPTTINIANSFLRKSPEQNPKVDLYQTIKGPIECTQVNIAEIFSILQAETGLQYVLDQGIADIQLSFSFMNPTLADILDLVLPAYFLDYIVLDSGIVRIGHTGPITLLKQENYKKEFVPAIAPPALGLDKRIEGPVEANGISLSGIMSILNAETDMRFVLGKDVANTKVTFSLQSPTIREFLETVLPSHGLEYVVRFGHVIIQKKGTEETNRKVFSGYTVQQGDTLHQIAEKFAVSIDELMNVNRMNTDDSLKVGQELMIPFSKTEN